MWNSLWADEPGSGLNARSWQGVPLILESIAQMAMASQISAKASSEPDIGCQAAVRGD